ncbi:MAG: zinc-ribbon domain-containing protein [Candidatus Limivicinus sp.]|jgi:uncharacterized membrane protein
MKICPNCSAQNDDSAVFCHNCGVKLDADYAGSQNGPEWYNQQDNNARYEYQQSEVKPYDHTSEFDAKDISDNKVFAMVCYVLSTMGIIIALLAGRKSEYAMFHVRQALKFTVLNLLVAVVMGVLCWTVFVPIAGAIFMLVMLVIRIICFVQVCQGKAKEPAIIRSIGFFK